ncbi:MAG: hypothetical protein R2764_13450 [Bacteroidales bacterium]
MKNRYLCPQCRSDLKIVDHIIFSAKTQKGIKGILLISPELGDYTILHDDQFRYEQGEHIDLFCPVCQGNLAIPAVDKDLAEVILIDEKGVEYEIIFSEVAGKKCTIKMKDKKIVESYGDDVDEYTNYWGAGPQY